MANVIRGMVHTLDEYDPTTLSVDPEESRDLLKHLYQHLFPKAVRHDLGEYYTPDWLAEHVLDKIGYDGDPDKRLLDPACGSGTFLVLAINRIKAWYEMHRDQCMFREKELVTKIQQNVIGFDLNPLAVMAARTNYLLAMRDLLRETASFEIPVYLCDSVMTPAEYGTLFEGGSLGKAKRLKTSVGEFLIATEIASSREHLGKYTEVLEQCIRDDYDAEEFVTRCEQEGLPVTEQELHKNIYEKLHDLDKKGQNGIWARIVKNAFAPLFTEKVDYVVGNPPWVNWESLPGEYRNDLKPLWQSYGLFTLSGGAGRLGGGKKDLSMLFLYVSADKFLKESARLGFVITQTVFKTKGAGDGFRRLQFEARKQTIWLRPLSVDDLSRMQVFEGATNRTAVFVCERQIKSFSYPLPYTMWTGPTRISQEETLQAVKSLVRRQKLIAVPVAPLQSTSPWLTVREDALPGLQKILGPSSPYKAWEGVNTGGLNGCFWIRLIKTLRKGNVLIENLYEVGKIKVKQVQCTIESDLIYPLVRGKDVSKWKATPSTQVILAQDPFLGKGIPESEMKRRFPKTFSYFKLFEGNSKKPERGSLRGRALYKRYFKPTDPFYSMYNVGTYTLEEWKVMWPEVGHTVSASVCGPERIEADKPVLPDHTIIAIGCTDSEEAHFICALLNSSPVQLAVRGYISLHPSPHVLDYVAIPRFRRNKQEKRSLAQLSKQAHKASNTGNMKRLAIIEAEIDASAAALWGITYSELENIQRALKELQ